MDYLDANKYGGIDARDRAASKNMREAKAIQTQMGLRPSSTMILEIMQWQVFKHLKLFQSICNVNWTKSKKRRDGCKRRSSFFLWIGSYGYDYGTAGCCSRYGFTDMLAPTPNKETFRDKFFTQAYKKILVNTRKQNFLNTGMDADTVAALENKAVTEIMD